MSLNSESVFDKIENQGCELDNKMLKDGKASVVLQTVWYKNHARSHGVRVPA